MPLNPLVLPKTGKRTPSKKKKPMCRDCEGPLRIGKNERVEGARAKLCPECFEKFAIGFFR